MTKKQELWRAREEMGTRSWASEKFLQKLDIIQTMRKNDKAIVGHIFRERIESWKTSRGLPGCGEHAMHSCEMDIIGRALDDILLLEAEMGEQGFIDMILRNSCWQEDRLLLRKFLDRVESSRLQTKKGNTRKSDEGTPVSLPQWSGDWRAAREQLVTDDF